MGENIDFENIKWGSFTKQFQAYKKQFPKSRVKDLDAFAKMILRNPKKFQPKTQKRASFYLNVILPPQSARGGGTGASVLKKEEKEEKKKKEETLIQSTIRRRIARNKMYQKYQPRNLTHHLGTV